MGGQHMSTGTVKGFEVGKNRDGTKDVILLQVEISDPDDIQTVEYMTHAGDDTIPPNESRVTILEIGEAWKIAIASNDGIKSTMKAGEKQLYSSADGIIKAFIKFLKDKNIEINGKNDNAVRFKELESVINEIKTDHNLLNTAFIAHVHPGVTSGGSSTLATITPGKSSSIDISKGKIDNIKVPAFGEL